MQSTFGDGAKVLAAVTAFFASVAASLPASNEPTVKQIGESIRDRFISAVRNCGAIPPFVPAVVVDPTQSIDVHYSFDDRTIHLTDWANLDPKSRAVITAWSAKGTLGLLT